VEWTRRAVLGGLAGVAVGGAAWAVGRIADGGEEQDFADTTATLSPSSPASSDEP